MFPPAKGLMANKDRFYESNVWATGAWKTLRTKGLEYDWECRYFDPAHKDPAFNAKHPYVSFIGDVDQAKRNAWEMRLMKGDASSRSSS